MGLKNAGDLISKTANQAKSCFKSLVKRNYTYKHQEKIKTGKSQTKKEETEKRPGVGEKSDIV